MCPNNTVPESTGAGGWVRASERVRRNGCELPKQEMLTGSAFAFRRIWLPRKAMLTQSALAVSLAEWQPNGNPHERRVRRVFCSGGNSVARQICR